MSLTNGMTGGAIFKGKMKTAAPTSNGSTDKFSGIFPPGQSSEPTTEQIPLPEEAPPEILPPTPTEAPQASAQPSQPTAQISAENIEKILKELSKLSRADAELLRKQEQLPKEIEVQIKQSLRALSAEAAQSYDDYLKAITAQRIGDATRALERLNAIEEMRKKQLIFSSRLKKLCVGLLIANASLLTLILMILILK